MIKGIAERGQFWGVGKLRGFKLTRRRKFELVAMFDGREYKEVVATVGSLRAGMWADEVRQNLAEDAKLFVTHGKCRFLVVPTKGAGTRSE